MMLSIVEMYEDESIFYNLEHTFEHKDLIVFPMHEFQIYMKIWKLGRIIKILFIIKFN